ncbi:MAG: hypothetical protein PHT49_11305 [Desulfovibrionales bacterium]|nr:hypothetical protein [Desulfovibrionales bacterium]
MVGKAHPTGLYVTLFPELFPGRNAGPASQLKADHGRGPSGKIKTFVGIPSLNQAVNKPRVKINRVSPANMLTP